MLYAREKLNKKRIVSLLLTTVIFIVSLLTLNSCQEPFTVYSCGSGFYFNRSTSKEYKIKELGVTSIGNSFFLNDYFYSTELGEPYTLKLGAFKKETIYLAKKADHYNSQIFEFNLDTYEDPIIKITADMSYVHIYSLDPSKEHYVYVEIEKRDLPVDITFENVNINTLIRLPVIFSQSMSDINIIVKGTNTFNAGKHEFNNQSYIDYLKNSISEIEKHFIESSASFGKEFENYINTFNDKGLADHLMDGLYDVGEVAYNAFENMLLGGMSILAGSDGEKGINGIPAIMHLGGISVSGDGTLTIKGGDGAKGTDANNSLFGMSNGGDGGRGGAGIHCGCFMSYGSVTLNVSGGNGGSGGAPSKGGFGLFGSSGEYGSRGLNGKAYDIAYPKE